MEDERPDLAAEYKRLVGDWQAAGLTPETVKARIAAGQMSVPDDISVNYFNHDPVWGMLPEWMLKKSPTWTAVQIGRAHV